MAEAKKQHPLAAFGGLVGAIGGFALSRYSGMSLLIPGVVTLLLMVLFNKTSLRPRYFRGAIAVTLGHVVWFVAAALMLGVWEPVLLDVILLLVAVALLWAVPHLVTAIVLGLIQAASLAWNLNTLSLADFGSASHRALTAHCLLRILAIAALIVGFIRMRRERVAQVTGFEVLPPILPTAARPNAVDTPAA